MKSYLLISLFFLGALSLPISISGQENPANQHAAQTENSVDHTSIEQQSDHLDQSSDISPTPYDVDHRDSTKAWPEHVPNEADTFQTKFFNMLFVLGLLIGFMILASWALKRMMKSKMTHLNTASSIKVLETRYLSPRATLYLIEVHDQNYLIAESPTNITYLTTFPIQEEEPASQEPPPFPGSKKL
jgi:flagellar protein FliO/FliZ